MTFYFRPIIPLTLAFVFGIMAGEALPGFRFAAWCLAVGFGMTLLLLLLRWKTAAILPMLLFAVLGYLSIQPWTSPEFSSYHIRFSATGDKLLITGVVLTSPAVSGFRQSFILKTEGIGRGDSLKKRSGKLRVSLSGREPELHVGDRISFVGRVRPIRSFRNPGGFDYERYMAFKGVWVTASGQGESVTIKERSVPVGLEVWISPLRRKAASLIEDAASGEAAVILKALLLGDRSSLTDTLRSDFQRVGIGHLLAISGLHVGLVATVVFVVFSRLFAYVPVFLRRAWTKKAAAAPAFAAVWGYAMLAGMSPSTQRAAIMVSVFLAAFPLGKIQDTLNSVAMAALFILIVQPPALFSASFQLSFGAVVSIVLMLSLTPKQEAFSTRGVWGAFSRRVVMFMLVSLSAILGTLPLVLYYFNETSLIGLFSNLIFIPVIGFTVVPLGLLSVLLHLTNIPLAILGLRICSFILTKTLSWVNWSASLPFSAVKTVTPSMIETLLYYCLLAAVGMMVHAYVKGRRNGLGNHSGGRRRVFNWAMALFISAVFGLTLDGLYWGFQRFWSNRLRVTVIDVGHGSAGLVEIPGGETILIDGGGFSDNASFDVGQRIVAPLLWRKKIRTVRTLVLSHPNSDHLNGLIYITRHFHVERLLSNGEPADTKGYGELLAVVRDKGVLMPDFDGMNRRQILDDVAVDLLYPMPGFQGKGEPWRDSNNNSLVVKVTYKDVSFLFPGDIMAAGERELIKTAGDRLASRVLVAPHHGSRTSSSMVFLEEVNPETVVVSSGWHDRYGTPHPEVSERYRQLGVRLFTTPEHGAVTLTTDGERLWIETAKKG